VARWTGGGGVFSVELLHPLPEPEAVSVAVTPTSLARVPTTWGAPTSACTHHLLDTVRAADMARAACMASRLESLCAARHGKRSRTKPSPCARELFVCVSSSSSEGARALGPDPARTLHCPPSPPTPGVSYRASVPGAGTTAIARVKKTGRFTAVYRGNRPNRAGPVPVRSG
jgi:hypothetical protein